MSGFYQGIGFGGGGVGQEKDRVTREGAQAVRAIPVMI